MGEYEAGVAIDEATFTYVMEPSRVSFVAVTISLL